MIRRDDDDLPTGSTADAPAWRGPGVAASGTSPPPPLDAASTIGRTPSPYASTEDATRDPASAVPTPRPAGSPPLPHRRIAQFLLLERIGAGGMGEVFAAFDDQLERKVAIKRVAARSSEARARQRLLREAQALARLSHPNVVTVYEVGALPDGGLFIAMELVAGQTLRAWQRDRRGGWREIVAAYAEAGRGLAAAHHRGIVHRDFKPDNVLVGHDGRVRVADFGLAYAADGAAAAAADDVPTAAAGAAGALAGDHGARPRLTVAGRFVGTPGYMAPEQLLGTAVDARADQFSFCVALYEALHGARPAADAELPPRRAAEPAYPRWLAELLQRGLARDPARRFATMDALLAELTRSRERIRRRAAVAIGLAAAATAAATVVVLRGAGEPPPCPLASDELTGVWDAATRQRGQAAILGTQTPFAASMWTATAAAFDRYAERWLAAHKAACEATHVRHVQSAELLDRRMDCLAARRRSLEAAADVLQQRPAQAVVHASEVVASLGDIEPCADTGVLLALSSSRTGPTLSASPATQARTSTVRQQLATATTLLATGDVAAAEPVVAAADQLATEIHDDALHAEIAYTKGTIGLARGEVPAALAAMNRAIELAVTSHHDELSADIWLKLATTGGNLEQRPAEIASWVNQAEAWIRRLGHVADSRRIAAVRARGNLERAAGTPRKAVATLSQAISDGETLWGKADPRLIPLLRDRASAQGQLHESGPAISDAEHALALGIATWGPEHPDLAPTRLALGLLYIEQPDTIDRGERELVLARTMYHDQLGADSIEIANCEQALCKARQYRGDHAAALLHAERADEIYTRRLGPDHPRRGEALIGLGALRFLRHDFTGSLAAYETSLSILQAVLGPTHLNIGFLLSNTGETLLALGRYQVAQADFAKALEILEPALGSQNANLAFPLKGLGLCHLQLGHPQRALPPLERALALRAHSTAGDPRELAEIRWALARTLRALGRDSIRSRALATESLAGYRGLGPELADRTQEISLWLHRNDDR